MIELYKHAGILRTRVCIEKHEEAQCLHVSISIIYDIRKQTTEDRLKYTNHSFMSLHANLHKFKR